MDADLTELFSAFPDHVEGFTAAFGNLLGEWRKLMNDMQRLRDLEGCYLIFPREENIGYLERSALVESQVRRLIEDVKKGVADLTSELPPNENVFRSSIDQEKKELSELQAEITNLKNELQQERSAYQLTKQSFNELDNKIQAIIDQSKTKSSIRARFAKATYKFKAMLGLSSQISDKKNVQG